MRKLIFLLPVLFMLAACATKEEPYVRYIPTKEGDYIEVYPSGTIPTERRDKIEYDKSRKGLFNQYNDFCKRYPSECYK